MDAIDTFSRKGTQNPTRKTLIQATLNSTQKLDSPQSNDSKVNEKGSYFNDHFLSNTDNLVCHICGEKDHIYTNGGKDGKLIQYYACKSFVDMTPSQRYRELTNRGLCIQCL